MFVSQSSAMALFSALALSMVSSVTSAPLAQVNMNGNGVMRMNVGKREVVAPPITSPTTGTVWTVGQTVTVTWDTSELPPPQNITNISGKILLGFLDDGDDSEHLDVDSPLAQGFNITTGSVQLTVPNVPAKDDYIIVLFGDSGNLSPKFTITGGSATSSSSTTASSSPLSSTVASSTSVASSPASTAVTSTSASASDPDSTSSSDSASSTDSSVSTTDQTTATSPVVSTTIVPATSTQVVTVATSSVSLVSSASSSTPASPSAAAVTQVTSAARQGSAKSTLMTAFAMSIAALAVMA